MLSVASSGSISEYRSQLWLLEADSVRSSIKQLFYGCMGRGDLHIDPGVDTYLRSGYGHICCMDLLTLLASLRCYQKPPLSQALKHCCF